MDPVKAHYDKLLGSVYSWILGDFDTAYQRNVELFETLDVSPFNSGLALDLGAGPGNQSIPLSERGFDVIAMDFCQALLDELTHHAAGRSVKPVLADITEFRHYVDGTPDLIVCMGDTLVHLPDKTSARTLLKNAATTLGDGGSMVVSIRDYDAAGPAGADRFIPIRSNAEQIFTCFLEYDDDVVRVSDMLQRKIRGEWQLSVSTYQKLRLSMDWVADTLQSEGLDSVQRLDDRGMLVLHARK